MEALAWRPVMRVVEFPVDPQEALEELVKGWDVNWGEVSSELVLWYLPTWVTLKTTVGFQWKTRGRWRESLLVWGFVVTAARLWSWILNVWYGFLSIFWIYSWWVSFQKMILEMNGKGILKRSLLVAPPSGCNKNSTVKHGNTSHRDCFTFFTSESIESELLFVRER